MKKITSLFIFIFFCGSVSAQMMKFQKTYQQLQGYPFSSNCVQQTSDSGYIMVGSVAASGWDLAIIKTDKDGNPMWSRYFHPSFFYGEIYYVKQCPDGGYIYTGYVRVDFTITEAAFLMKTDGMGNMLWIKTFEAQRGNCVQPTADGGYILACSTDTGFGAGHSDMYLVKTDGNGNMLWNKTYGGINDDYSCSVQEMSNGGYIIAGTTFSFGAGGDVYLVRTDVNGNLQWSKAYGGTNTEEGKSLDKTSDGGFIISAKAYDSFGYPDYYLLKTDGSGNLQWSKTFGGTLDDYAYSVQQTTDQGYIMSGYSYSFGAASFGDVYVVKTDLLGNLQWSKIYGGLKSDMIGYTIQTFDGGYVTLGTSACFNSQGVAQFYLIKSDGLGDSQCNQSNPATVEAVHSITVTTPSTIVSTGGAVTVPSVTDYSTVVVNNLCFTTEVYEPGDEEMKVEIFPNPATSQISITNSQSSIKEIEIYSSIGKKIFSQLQTTPDASGHKQQTIDVSQLPPGIYFIIVTNQAGNKVTKKVVKH